MVQEIYVIENTNKFSEYHYITVGNITLHLIDPVQKLENFKKEEITIQDEKINLYKIEKAHKVGLIYGTNIKTGNTSYYVYDKNEETLSKYYDDEVDLYKDELTKTKRHIMILMGGFAFIGMILIISSIAKDKKRNSKRRYV